MDSQRIVDKIQAQQNKCWHNSSIRATHPFNQNTKTGCISANQCQSSMHRSVSHTLFTGRIKHSNRLVSSAIQNSKLENRLVICKWEMLCYLWCHLCRNISTINHQPMPNLYFICQYLSDWYKQVRGPTATKSLFSKLMSLAVPVSSNCSNKFYFQLYTAVR